MHIRHLNGVVNHQRKPQSIVLLLALRNLIENEKRLFSTEATSKIVSNISPYLVEGSDTFVVAMKESLDGMPKMSFGNQPRDGGYFVIKEEEYQEIMEKEPELKKWIHPYIGADEFIKGKKRWCLWLKACFSERNHG